MKILSVETSAVTASCAIYDGGHLLAATELRTRMTHSQTILPMVTDLLKNCNLKIADMDALAVSTGPGSFTGVRIGVSAVKGLAFAGDIPCVSVSTLEAMAYQVAEFAPHTEICAVMDARCAQVYTASFMWDGEKLNRMTEDMAISMDDLKSRWLADGQKVFLVGDGAQLCYTTLHAQVPQLTIVPEQLRYQHAIGVAMAAVVAVKAGKTVSADMLQPQYLRLPQAERELKARLAKENI